QEGLLLKAIAVCKLILEIDEAHKETQSMLADLYSKKGGRGDTPLPIKAPAAAAGPGAPPPLPMEVMDVTAQAEPIDEGFDVEIEQQTQVVEAVSLPPPPPSAAQGELPQIPLFSDLSKNAFIALMERMKMRQVQTNEPIIEEGDKGDSFFIIAQ